MNEMSEMTVGAGATPQPDVQYVGFWARVLASFVDTFVSLFVLVPLALLLRTVGIGIANGDPYASTITQLLLALIVIAFWMARMATPGKMVIDAVIVDARSFGKPSLRQFVVRYLGYFVSTIALFLGLLWVAFDARKQGWHDKLADTVVIRRPPNLPQGLS
ncbi:RDD family protein [Solimonas marina]|uniref:RDD family protein n=1 Tax=Solimonas marina TaxID=2714601 RepID=A0A969W875_9GAMM|nr:RDD family protein [Solimonas marina]NKF21288.1 RDD family protein [Solimonas marina]